MENDREIVVDSLIRPTLSCSLGAASLLLKKKRKHSTWVKKYIRMENVTLYYRNLLLRKWWNVFRYVNRYRSIRAIAIHGWATVQEKYHWSCRVVSKFHYTDPQTLSATQPDPGTKSVHVDIAQKCLRPKSAKLSETRADPIGLCRSPTKSGWACLVKYGHISSERYILGHNYCIMIRSPLVAPRYHRK